MHSLLLKMIFILLSFLHVTRVTAALETADVIPPSNSHELQIYLNTLGLWDKLNHTNFTAPSRDSPSVFNQAGCSSACTLVAKLIEDIVSFPATPLYVLAQRNYWSIQQVDSQPTCRVAPRSAEEVAITYLITATFNCQFAIKGGGHAAFGGASNIQDGITIDLMNLTTITINEDKTIAQIGAGNKWINMYEYLTPMNLSVVGGRVSDIGVSGLTLGGGISYFSGRYGWACDGVRNYQIVLANGRICNANVNTNPDLYWALRGGGNNFGIVTRLDLETFPQGDMLGGVNTYPITTNASIFQAYQNFVAYLPQDPDAALIVAFFYSQGQWLASNDYEYAKPVRQPPIFQEFFAIPALASTERITNLTDITAELTTYNPAGFRETYITATFTNNAEIQQQIFDIFLEDIDPIKNFAGVLPALVMQPISQSVIAHFSKNGGNALGLADTKGPLMLVNLAVMWSDAADDDKVYAATSRVIQRSTDAAKKLGVYNKYIYQNYAAKGQDVFAGYGEANRQRLIKISEKYDTKGVFQKLQPGYFKLGRF